MHKTTPFLCLTLLALVASAGFADEWKKSFTVSGRADLRVDVADGEAIVRTWDRSEIEARITTEGWKIGPSEVRVTDNQAGDRVQIDVRVPRVHINFGRRSVRVELQVPRELRAEIHSGDGRISAQDLKGEIHLSTGDGSIEADSVDGIFEAKTGDGRIRASGRWNRLNLETNDGSVEAEARSGSTMASAWRVRTGDGSVTLRLPENFAADLDAHTGDGKITVDFPVTASGTFGASELRGKLNGGGQTLVVRTGDGPIRLRPL
jgi:DUF4097 and DUF4098 domain-containing protein YvlB